MSKWGHQLQRNPLPPFRRAGLGLSLVLAVPTVRNIVAVIATSKSARGGAFTSDGKPRMQAVRNRPPPSKPEYRTPQATVDCFFGWIVRQDEATQARWLAEHPKDAAYLRKLWEDKCKAQSK